MNALCAFLFEQSPWNEFWSAWLVGFCDVDFYGQVFLTRRGEEYLDRLAGGLGLVGVGG